MYISKSSHNEIVRLYEARLDEQKRQYEARLAHLEGELSFYRNGFAERFGLKFLIPKPSEVTAISPSMPVTVPSEIERRKTFRLDMAEWSEDDREWYNDYHVNEDMLKEAKPQDEAEYWYFQYHGSRTPLEVYGDRHFKV